MHRRLTVAVVMVLILVLAASAAMADPPRTWKMRGSQGLIVGRYTDNFDYQGTRTVPIGGGFTLKVNSAADTGVVTAYGYGTFTPEYDVHLTGWLTIVMDTWIEMAPFMDGGIAEDVILHGDTGQGPSVMPTIWSGLAGWGEADVYVNGSLVYEDLDGHFMYTEKARRDRDPVGGYPIAIGAFGAYTHSARVPSRRPQLGLGSRGPEIPTASRLVPSQSPRRRSTEGSGGCLAVEGITTKDRGPALRPALRPAPYAPHGDRCPP
jgi:hypothetical protein